MRFAGSGARGLGGLVDRWREILSVLARRKLRTALTALSVAWGIYMLVVLLATGGAISNGAENEFARDAKNSVWVSPGRTSKPYRGRPKGQRVRLDTGDYALVRDTLSVADHSSIRYNPPGSVVVSRGPRSGVFPVRGVLPDYRYIEDTRLVAGRYLNDRDVAERRKVAVIGKKVQDALFPRGVDPIGERLRLALRAPTATTSSGGGGAGGAGGAGGGGGAGGAPAVMPESSRGSEWTVIGVSEDLDEEREQQILYVPAPTAQLVWSGGTTVHELMFTAGDATPAEVDGAVDDLRRAVAARHGFAPDDKDAFGAWNAGELQARITGLFDGIRTFIWVIGLGTILAGVVGVSNVMLISVQERTREIGVRKALGATPASVVGMILQEALALTLVSGYVGLVGAVATVEGMRKAIPSSDFFRDPGVDLRVGLAATLVLVLAGMLAGAIPARRAASVHPIEALRAE